MCSVRSLHPAREVTNKNKRRLRDTSEMNLKWESNISDVLYKFTSQENFEDKVES